MPSTNGHHQGSPTTGAHANGSNGPKGAKHEKAAEFAFGTLAVHAGSPHDPATGAVIESISLSTTFSQNELGKPIGEHDYSRAGNPNRDNLETSIARLEHAKYGLAFSSGSAALATIVQTLPAGSHVVSINDVYGGTYRYLTRVAPTHGIEVTFCKSLETELEGAIQPGKTKLVWAESPTNPTLSLVDIRVVADIAHRHGLTLVVDNTFLSPYIQNPLDHGADLVMHSVSKYLNGHSDVILGCIVTNDEQMDEKLRFLQKSIGAVPSAFDCWLAHRGVKTVHLRVREANRNAALVAQALTNSERVEAVNYPGLKSHPQREIALKQHRDGMGGGMISFRLKGTVETAERFCKATRLFTLAESLGGVESLCEVPAAMTHASMPREAREAAGVYDNLIRLSCGVEDGEDLVRDVLSAIEKAVV